MSGDDSTTLGRSLASVFARTPKVDAPNNRTIVQEIEIGLLRPSPSNPRRSYDNEHLEELAASIRSHGILQPLVVLRRAGWYEILAGERRFRAASLAGCTRVPAIVREEDNPQHSAELRLIENIQREDLNPLELARAYQSLLHDHGLTHEDLAVRVGKDRSSITNTLRLLALPEEVQRLVERGALSPGHAKVILGAATPEAMLRLARMAVEKGWSVRALEQAMRETNPAATPTSKERPAHLRELEQNLSRLLGAPVVVRGRGQKGSITVSFTSKAAFQRIVEVLDQACRDAQRRRDL